MMQRGTKFGYKRFNGLENNYLLDKADSWTQTEMVIPDTDGQGDGTIIIVKTSKCMSLSLIHI